MGGASSSFNPGGGYEEYVDLKNCHCQAQLDLLCKFHHLDADIVYGEHSAEEIHHCDRPAGSKGGEYKIIHCGCPPVIECQKCLHVNKKACMARKTHAISLRVVTAALHINFVATEDFIKNAIITLEFDKKCPKNSGYYHMQTADFGCMASFNLDDVFLKLKNKAEKLEHDLLFANHKNDELNNAVDEIKKQIKKLPLKAI